MTQARKHSAAWILAVLLVAALWLGREPTAPGQAHIAVDRDKLPRIEKTMHEKYVEKLTDRVSFEMLPIPGGIYLMGSPPSEKGRKPDEGPQHPVAVRPFWMGKLEVTWEEYDLFFVKKGAPKPAVNPKDKVEAITRPTPPYVDPTFGYGHDGFAALNVGHHAAMEYCRWISAKTGKTYRLPTEAEWEWACRAGTTTAYSFGDDPAKLDDYAWHEKNSDEASHKTGTKKPNPWGLYDMHGNIAEWCIDHYQKDTYAKSPLDIPSLQPVVLPSANRYPYVTRGGSWIDPPDMCRSAARRASSKDWLRRDPQRPQSIWWMTDADYVGFRVVRAVEEQVNLKDLKSKVTRESQ